MCLSVVPQKNPTRKELNKFLSYICEGQGCFKGTRCAIPSLQWRHNGRDGVSNHQPLDCLFNRLFRCRSRKHQSSASLAYVRGIHRWPVNSPHKGPVTREMFPIDDAIMFIWYRVVVDNCTVTSHERHIVSNHDQLFVEQLVQTNNNENIKGLLYGILWWRIPLTLTYSQQCWKHIHVMTSLMEMQWVYKQLHHRWIPRKKANDAELWCFLWSVPE